MDSSARFRVDMGVSVGTLLWALVRVLISWDPCPFGLTEILTVAVLNAFMVCWSIART